MGESFAEGSSSNRQNITAVWNAPYPPASMQLSPPHVVADFLDRCFNLKLTHLSSLHAIKRVTTCQNQSIVSFDSIWSQNFSRSSIVKAEVGAFNT